MRMMTCPSSPFLVAESGIWVGLRRRRLDLFIIVKGLDMVVIHLIHTCVDSHGCLTGVKERR
jgi:hypothetical protein